VGTPNEAGNKSPSHIPDSQLRLPRPGMCLARRARTRQSHLCLHKCRGYTRQARYFRGCRRNPVGKADTSARPQLRAVRPTGREDRLPGPSHLLHRRRHRQLWAGAQKFPRGRVVARMLHVGSRSRAGMRGTSLHGYHSGKCRQDTRHNGHGGKCWCRLMRCTASALSIRRCSNGRVRTGYTRWRS
jgi:hypothetical protein